MAFTMRSFTVWVTILGSGWICTVFAKPRQLQQWQGEYFSSKEGGFYLKADPKGNLIDSYSFTVKLVNKARKRSFFFSQTIDEVEGPPQEVWKIPTGTYRITSVSISGPDGTRRIYKPRKMKPFIVRKHSLSNLGLWRMVPIGKRLIVKFLRKKNSYREKNPKSKSSVAYIIGGFTGNIESTFAGKKIFRSKAPGETESEARIVLRSTQQIGMFYSLNLFKHNRYAQRMMTALEEDDPKMRECYSDRLQSNPRLQGDLKFRFILSKISKGMKSLKRSGGSIKDSKLTECIFYRLAALTFPVNSNMIGEVIYNFSIQEE